MTTSIPQGQLFSCPRCHAPTSLANLHCSACGVNLIIAVAREASQLLSGDPISPDESDRQVPRLGEVLLKNGDITPARLEMALAHQRATPGGPRTIGQILLEMEAVNLEQLDRASLAQMRELQQALEENSQQLTSLTDRIRYLESALSEMVKLNQSATSLLAGLSNELEAPLQQLQSSSVAGDESASQALTDLGNVIGHLRRSFLEDDER
ncbi:MAG TPA: hypothetical protein VI547_07370 [Anaerolineales bacterium]|nr:hypothetical protein [Anaerolineales bacterium]